MSAKKRRQQELSELTDVRASQQKAMEDVQRQLRTATRFAVIALVVVWLLALGFWSGLESLIPLYVAGGLTLAMGVVALMVRRNLSKSRELGMMMGGEGLSERQRTQLEQRIHKGDTAAILTRAQMQMQEDPRKALETLEKADLEKGQKLLAHQVRAMRAMIHLNLGEVKAARSLADAIDLQKAPDPKTRANLASVVAESWARSGNPIEASQLLNKFDPEEADMKDVRVQIYRARAFAEAHRNKLNPMRKALKELEAVSPQLLAVFVGQKRVHPMLMQEARRRLEKSGMIPNPRIQGARR
ncbi:MAG: hypothetical protein ACFB9M_10725 [Myxococcota bacterium]